MTDTYTLTLTVSKEQAQVLSGACEAIARIGMGQLDTVLGYLPVNRNSHPTLDNACRMLEQVALMRGSPGIFQASQRSKVAWDLYQVVRHRLAWDRAYASGVVQPGELRKWPEMMQVNFDEPVNTAGGELATIRATKGAA